MALSLQLGGAEIWVPHSTGGRVQSQGWRAFPYGFFLGFRTDRKAYSAGSEGWLIGQRLGNHLTIQTEPKQGCLSCRVSQDEATS